MAVDSPIKPKKPADDEDTKLSGDDIDKQIKPGIIADINQRPTEDRKIRSSEVSEEPNEEPQEEEQVEARQTPEQERSVARQVAGQAAEAAKAKIGDIARKRVLQQGLRALAAIPQVRIVLIALAAIAIVIVLVIMLALLLVGLSSLSPEFAGSSPVQAIDTTSSVDLSALQKVRNGGVLTPEKARELLQALQTIRPQVTNRQGAAELIDQITVAAQQIVDNPSDAALAKRQTAVIIKHIEDLLEILDRTRQLPNGATLLNVPLIGEGSRGHCGSASFVMVVLYYNPSYSDSRYLSPTARGEDGVRLTAPHDPMSCNVQLEIDRNVPPQSRGWIRVDWPRAGKENVLTAIKRSLAAGDPVVMYFEECGIYCNSKHIVVVVGYSPADDTYYIHDPLPPGFGRLGRVRANTNVAGRDAGRKLLTGEHLMRYMGGDGNPYFTSIIVRRAHTR